MKITERLQHAWNAFNGESNTFDPGWGSMSPPHKTAKVFNDKVFASAIFNRIAMDVSMTAIEHVKMNMKEPDKHDRERVESGLNYCLNTEANIDQTSIQLMHDIVYSMFDEGCVALVPIDTTSSPTVSGSYDIVTMRTGRITQWYPDKVKVMIYNEKVGYEQEVMVLKKNAAIFENPLFAVVNGPNATLTRLIKKMKQVDDVDEVVASGKLDLILQLPYAVKSDLRLKQAKARIDTIEKQLQTNRHGIAYVDGAEKITQLNRPMGNQMDEQIQYLSTQFYNQLGLTENVFNGTANESEMRGYYTRTIDPIINHIIAEMERKFLTKTARSQGHTLEAYRDPFSLVPIEQLARIGDSMRRNRILTSNELRAIMGYRPSKDPEADMLNNPNMPDEDQNLDGSKKKLGDSPGSVTSPVEDEHY